MASTSIASHRLPSFVQDVAHGIQPSLNPDMTGLERSDFDVAILDRLQLAGRNGSGCHRSSLLLACDTRVSRCIGIESVNSAIDERIVCSYQPLLLPCVFASCSARIVAH